MKGKSARIRILFLDVDGVLTDGHIVINEKGEETKAFHVRDGLGLKMLMSAGIEVIIMTGRTSMAVAHRAKELGIKEIYQGTADKQALCKRIIRTKGVEKVEVGCIGDDLPDLAMFREAGLCIAVADAAEEVRREADLVTKQKGGHGAVREACEWILKHRGLWPKNGFTE
ncbi:MAG: HAD hydrolase family protein [Deltaproteobacteria bacterium]|nr:HAD hydrolase family protein [Deltaproteobacteria bacterium]